MLYCMFHTIHALLYVLVAFAILHPLVFITRVFYVILRSNRVKTAVLFFLLKIALPSLFWFHINFSIVYSTSWGGGDL